MVVFKRLWNDISLGYPRILGKKFRFVVLCWLPCAKFPLFLSKLKVLSLIHARFFSLWNEGFKDQFREDIAKIKVDPPQDWKDFMGAAMYVKFQISNQYELAAEKYTTNRWRDPNRRYRRRLSRVLCPCYTVITQDSQNPSQHAKKSLDPSWPSTPTTMPKLELIDSTTVSTL